MEVILYTYDELCRKFEEPQKTGNARISQMSRWKLQADIVSVGRKYSVKPYSRELALENVLEEVDRMDKTTLGSYLLANYCREILRNANEPEGGCITFEQRELDQVLGLVNGEYYSINKKNMTSCEESIFYVVKSANKKVITSVMAYLDRNFIASCNEIYFVKAGSAELTPANPQQELLILNAYSKALGFYGVRNLGQLRFTAKADYKKFYEMVNADLLINGITYHNKLFTVITNLEHLDKYLAYIKELPEVLTKLHERTNRKNCQTFYQYSESSLHNWFKKNDASLRTGMKLYNIFDEGREFETVKFISNYVSQDIIKFLKTTFKLEEAE